MRSGDTAAELSSRRPVLPGQDWRVTLAATLLALLTVIAGVVVWRRLAGAFARPVPDFAACAAVTLALATGLAAHFLLLAAGCGDLRRAGSMASGAAALLPGVALGGALLSGGSAVALACAGTLFVFSGAVVVATAQPSLVSALSRLVALENFGSRRKVAQTGLRLHQGSGEEVATLAPAAQFPLPSSVEEPKRGDGGADSARDPGRRTHWMTRSLSADGCELLNGAVSVQFLAGQRQAVAHVPFSPPFSEPPQIECEVLDGVAARVKVAAIYPFGARIEARRSERSEEPQAAMIGFRVVAGRKCRTPPRAAMSQPE